MSESLRGLLDGIELADSVVWDAHKMLRTSALCAAVLVRRRADIPAAFQQQASYLDFDNPHGFDAIDRQVQCSSAEIAGRRYLRVTVMSPATDADTFARLLDAIEAAAQPAEASCFAAS